MNQLDFLCVIFLVFCTVLANHVNRKSIEKREVVSECQLIEDILAKIERTMENCCYCGPSTCIKCEDGRITQM